MWEERPEWQKKFYNSVAWRKCRDGFAASKSYVCELCHNEFADASFEPFIKQFHVHHKIKLTELNVGDPEISLNWNNLQLLCQHCHNMTHYSPSPIPEGLYFDENGDLKKYGGTETGHNSEREKSTTQSD